MDTDAVLQRNNVRVLGRSSGPALVLVQGFGCDQVIWDRILPDLTKDFKVVLLDHVGTGGSRAEAYDPVRYSSLDRYRNDLVEVLDALELQDAAVLGHTIAGAMALAATLVTPRIGRLILLCTSPRYLNDDGYAGGFEPEDLESVIDSLEANYPLWAASVAPGVTGSAAGSALSSELTERLCRLHPDYVRDFLRVSFTADVRQLLPQVRVPSLVLQTGADPLTPQGASRYLHEHLAGSAFQELDARGSMPHLNSPRTTAAAILEYLGQGPRG